MYRYYAAAAAAVIGYVSAPFQRKKKKVIFVQDVAQKYTWLMKQQFFVTHLYTVLQETERT
jgi:nitrous oxide reductase accessory protein NosL